MGQVIVVVKKEVLNEQAADNFIGELADMLTDDVQLFGEFRKPNDTHRGRKP